MKHGCAPLTTALVLGLACLATPGRADVVSDGSTLNSMVRYFVDSGHVTVRSLINDYALPLEGDAALTVHWNNEHVTIPAIQAPVGSPEAIDAITTASRPISGNAYQDYVKTRNEFEGSLTKGPAAVDGYYSIEEDFVGRQVGAHYNRDLMSAMNLAVVGSYGWDDIKPLPDDRTSTPPSERTTKHVSAVGTQILGPASLLRYGLELNVVDGLQHNPYRNVFAGGTHVPERHPDHRERRDAFVKFNQYLPNRSSMKLDYRLYNDDWGITSHEIETDLDQYITHSFSAHYEYRYYTQTRAYFYQSEYATVNGVDGYLSGDYRMNVLSSHLFGASFHMDMDALAASHTFFGRMAVWLNYERYFNSNNYSADILETGLDFHFQ